MATKRVAVVTGANKGIGFEIARKLGNSGMKTILACRNDSLGQEAAHTLVSEGCDVEFYKLDIGDESSVAAFAEKLARDYNCVDVLVNNAAIAFKNSDPTSFQDQAAPTVSVNYIGTLNVIKSVSPLLRKSSSPRIVNVASQVGHLRIIPSKDRVAFFTSPSLTIDELTAAMREFVEAAQSGRHSAEGWPNTCYGTSKLGVIALTKILAREEPTMLVNACCPGFCSTDMSSRKGTRTAEEGARTPAFLALLPDGGPTGKFFLDEKEIEW
jgi:carbonyl reductase 1